MGRLDRLELHNFKSYGGDVVVGPFKGFTAIIGTNGSGKSNLMDAISFVLGVRTSQLRGNQLRDLVYRNLDDPSDDPSRRKASVKLIYRKGTGEDSDEEVEFMRSVTLAGSSEYRVQGKVLSLEKYNAELAKIGVLVKARNFLVFQNEVESIASKSPKELAAMFEEVSESAQYRQRYEAARVERDAAEEEVTQFWRKRKDMAAEKRQYKEQKDEAERYRRLQREIAKTKTEKSLYELFHVDEDLRTVKAEVTDIMDELEVKERQFSKKESALRAEKKRVADLEKERAKLERKKNRLADEIEKLRPLEVKYETEKSALSRRIKGDERNLSKKLEEFEESEEAVRSLESELQSCIEEIKMRQEEIREAEEASMSAESMAEYRSLKDVVATRTSALQQELEVAKQNVHAAQRQKSALEGRERDLRERKSTAENDGSVYKKRSDELSAQVVSTEDEIGGFVEEQARTAEVCGERDGVRRTLERKIGDFTQQLRDARADMNESSRERSLNQALESMQRLFGDAVHGRLSDLCQPTQAKYREAIAVVFGKMMDAIVVENEKVGNECIRYLKDQRVGMATFIPIENVRPRPVDESLRRLGGSARLVIDVVRSDDKYQKAVQYAAGNAVVCDTLDEARRLRYDGGRKIKICSVDGTLINKAGFMTGGVGRAEMDRARKWDRGEIDSLKRKRASAQEELDKMGDAEADRRNAAALSDSIEASKRKLAILKHDQREAALRADACSKDLILSTNEIDLLRPQLQAAVTAFRKASEKVSVLEGRLHGLENELFGDFAQRHGIESVQQFEEQFVRKSEKIREKKLELETKESNIRSSLQYRKSRQDRVELTRLEKKIDAHTMRKSSLDESLENLGTKRAELESRMRSVGKEVEDVASQRQEAVDLIAERRQEFRKENEAVSETKKQLAEKRAKMDHLREQKKKLLTAAKVAQVDIPTREPDSDEENALEAQDAEQDADGDALMAPDGNADADESDPAAVVVNVNVRINYSSLSRKLRAAATHDKQREILGTFSEKVRSMEQQLDGLVPNMRATEHMSEAQAKLTAIDREAEAARERARKAGDSFEDVKQKRQDLFNNCFSHVADKINEVYRELTKSSAYPMGGTAYLSLEQQDEAYLGGIKFNAMPPTKRFRDMDQLSGGERSVAALALLFAVHDFRPSPFFVLDEVDAALDNLNVGKVSTYVKSRAPDLQTIVISLKDSFYERADALVGIYRDVSLKSSRLLTLDLTNFDEASQSRPVAQSG